MQSSQPDNPCFECNHPEKDHPNILLVASELDQSSFDSANSWVMENGEKHLMFLGNPLKIKKICHKFIGVKQLELF